LVALLELKALVVVVAGTHRLWLFRAAEFLPSRYRSVLAVLVVPITEGLEQTGVIPM
jgi:hypothetical protein